MSLCASGTPCSTPLTWPFPSAPSAAATARRAQRFVALDRHESVEARLPLRDAVETGLRHLARRKALPGDRACDLGQRQQCGFGGCLVNVHFAALMGVTACTSRKVAGSRSNGSVPATGAKPSNAGPMELAMRAATSALTGTPATSAIALISLGLGLVMRHWLLLARGCALTPGWPCSTPPDGPSYRGP